MKRGFHPINNALSSPGNSWMMSALSNLTASLQTVPYISSFGSTAAQDMLWDLEREV